MPGEDTTRDRWKFTWSRGRTVIATATVFLLALCYFLWRRVEVARARWERALHRLEQDKGDLPGLSASRAVLFGRAEAGKAFDCYREIPSLIAGIGRSQGDLLQHLLQLEGVGNVHEGKIAAEETIDSLLPNETGESEREIQLLGRCVEM